MCKPATAWIQKSTVHREKIKSCATVVSLTNPFPWPFVLRKKRFHHVRVWHLGAKSTQDLFGIHLFHFLDSAVRWREIGATSLRSLEKCLSQKRIARGLRYVEKCWSENPKMPIFPEAWGESPIKIMWQTKLNLIWWLSKKSFPFHLSHNFHHEPLDWSLWEMALYVCRCLDIALSFLPLMTIYLLFQQQLCRRRIMWS